MFEEFGEGFNAEGIEKLNQSLELEKYKIVTDKIVNNDRNFINTMLTTPIFYGKYIDLLNKVIEHHKINEDYELCVPLHKVMIELQKRQLIAKSISY